MQRLKDEYCRDLPVFRDIVKMIGKMLTIDSGHRPTAINIEENLQALV